MDTRGGERGCGLEAPFFRNVAGPLFNTFALSFALFCLKADELLWSKSYVFQKKAKVCVKGGLLTTLMRR